MDEKIAKILAILENFDLYRYDRGNGPYGGSDTEVLGDFLEKNNINVMVRCGMTKICIVIPNYKYVIKMDRDGHKECETEAKIFQIAQAHRVERAFLETKKIGENSFGISFYSQPKVGKSLNDMDIRDINALCAKLRKANISSSLVRKINYSCYSSLDKTWIEAAVLYYGKRFMRELEKVLCLCYINDLHDGNIGFVKNRPVLFDYSGYHGPDRGERYYIREEV